MKRKFKTHAVYYKDRKRWVLYYRDPVTKRRHTKVTELTVRNKTAKIAAERLAATWEEELKKQDEERTLTKENTTWEHFRSRYEEEIVPSLAPRTGLKICTVFNSIEEIVSPKFLHDLTPESISRYQAQLRVKGKKGKPLSEHTIAGNLSHLRAALNWAVENELIKAIPKIRRPKRAKLSRQMKGRPITQEEFERMLSVLPKAVAYEIPQDNATKINKIVASWRYFLQGLWWSGLRLSESLDFHWDDERKIRPVLVGKRSLLLIPASAQKSNKQESLSMPPELVEFLSQTPEAKRKGYVFNPLPQRSRGGRLPTSHVGKVISAIGALAKVVVHRDAKGTKYASAHDLRRSFGTRWSKRVQTFDLKRIMRHESIQTTERYYVEEEVNATSRTLWDAYSKSKSHQEFQHGPSDPVENQPIESERNPNDQ